MAEVLMKLDEADNPEYYGLWREHNELRKRWDEVNKEIHQIRVPKLTIWRSRKKLNKTGLKLAKLHKDYLDWRNKAVNFQMNPRYKIARNENAPILYLHATENMRNLTDMLESNMILIANNYNSVHMWLDNKVNFLVAMGSFILAMAALVITLISISGCVF